MEGQGGFTGALAALAAHFTSSGPIDICSLQLGFDAPNATAGATAVCGGGGGATAPSTTG